jgi:uncharacterized protein
MNPDHSQYDKLSITTFIQSLEVGMRHVISRQGHLNAINVYPVPDGDTGTNLALFFGGILNETKNTTHHTAENYFSVLENSAVLHSRGNSGTIFAQFFLGLSDVVKNSDMMLSVSNFVDSIKMAYKYAYQSVSNPQEGTILTVMKGFSNALESACRSDSAIHFYRILHVGIEQSKKILLNTPNQLKVLKKAGVVDAGAQAFVDFLNGMFHFLKTGDAHIKVEVKQASLAHKDCAHHSLENSAYRYCTECVIRGTDINCDEVRSYLSKNGDSVVMAGNRSCAKIHAHVNDPGVVFNFCSNYGDLERCKADDMYQQISARVSTQRIAIVTDSTADLSPDVINELNIHVVPLMLSIADETFLDKLTITPEIFYKQIKNNTQLSLKTSQPSLGAFLQKYEYLMSHFDNVVAIHVSSKLSGTLNSSVQAAKQVSDKIKVIDSYSFGVELGILVRQAAIAAQANRSADDIVALIDSVKRKTSIYGIPENLEYAVRGGRLPSRAKKLLDFFNLKPILTVSAHGKMKVASVTRAARSSTADVLLKYVQKKIRSGETYDLVITHMGALQTAEYVCQRLREHPQVGAVSIEISSPAVGVHIGPGGVGVALHQQ